MTDQLQLPGDWPEEAMIQDEQRRGVFSGVNLQQYDPEKFELILQLLAEDKLSIRQIARATRSSRNLISSMRVTCAREIEPLKQRIASGALHVAELCQEREIELLNDPEAKLSLRDLAIAKAVNIDKAQLLSGEPTHIISASDPDHTAARAYLEGLTTGAVIGLRAGKSGQRGEGAALAGGDPAGAGQVLEAEFHEVQVVCSDSESDVSERVSEQSGVGGVGGGVDQEHADQAPGPGAQEAADAEGAREPGAGGGAPRAGGPL